MPLDVLGSGWYSILNDPLSLLSMLLEALRALLGAKVIVKNPTTRGICSALSITPLSARGHGSGLGLAFIHGLLGATWSPLA